MVVTAASRRRGASCSPTLPELEEPPLRYLDTDSATTGITAETALSTGRVARRTRSLIRTLDRFWKDK